MAVAESVGAAQHVVPTRLEGHRCGRAEPLGELGERLEAPAATRPGDHDERALIAGRREPVQIAGQLGDGFVPGHLLEPAGAADAAALQGVRDPIGMKRDLNRCLSARAKSTLTDRMARSPFELLRDGHLHDAGLPVADRLHVGFHDARRHATAGAAQRTHARLALGHARHEVFVRDESNELMLWVAAAGERRGSPSDCGQLDEISTVHAT